MTKLIVILGPTASGKTKLAVSLAKKFNGEIISADSRQIYVGMDIGTGKDIKEYDGVPFHLINITKPNDDFNVAKFKIKTEKIIKNIIKRGKIPFLVGGTGLYLSAIIDNYDIPQIKPDPKIRAKINSLSQVAKISLLKKLDPKAIDLITVDNPRRLNRALEICLSGYKFSETKKEAKPLFDTLQIGIGIERVKLNKIIDTRVDKMITAGLVNEVKNLLKKFGANSVPLATIGYTEIIDYLNKKTTLTTAIELIKIHTHQYAKRQMTWFKRDPRIHWIKTKSEAEKIIKRSKSKNQN